MQNWWQHLPETISPVIFTIGSFQLRWYGLMYVVAFMMVYLLVMRRYQIDDIKLDKEAIQSWFGYAILGVLLGGRLGYVLFYNPEMIFADPLGILLPFRIRNGITFTGLAGMSYHGGVIAVFLLSLLFCRRKSIPFWELTRVVIPAIPLGYVFGRLGNFINGELYGRITAVPWGMYFPTDPTGELRHPSQLYEAFFEGLVLFIVLWRIRNTKLAPFVLPIYLIGYGFVRFFIEFVRKPDAHLGTVLGPFSMGQVLCVVMMVTGVLLISLIAKTHESENTITS